MHITNRVILILSILLGAALGTQAQTPRYQTYVAPFTQVGGDAAEPSIGVDWQTNNILFQAGLETLRINFDDSTSPGQSFA